MSQNIVNENQSLRFNNNSVNTEECNHKTVKWSHSDHILWWNVFWFICLHIGAIYGAYLCFGEVKVLTIIWALFMCEISKLGITAGSHRLWSHRSYKARLPLRIMLAIFTSIAHQDSIYVWTRDHRVHHKYTETNADPYNSMRGFFFSHCGWLMSKKHPDVKELGKKIDLSDILADPVVAFQQRFYIQSVLLFAILLPTVIPYYLWSETLWNSFFVAMVLRYMLSLNSTWLVNSAAHMFGHKPYDVNISPVENLSVAALTLGEGYHNYHHTFPWDYSTSEWGWSFNLTTLFLDQMANIGWVYDRRYVSKDIVEKRKSRTGPKTEENQILLG